MCEIASSADVLNLIPLSEFLCVFSGRMTFIFFLPEQGFIPVGTPKAEIRFGIIYSL